MAAFLASFAMPFCSQAQGLPKTDPRVSELVPPQFDTRKPLKDIPALKDFEKWPLVSPTGHQISSRLSFLCRVATPDDLKNARAVEGPHVLRSVNVYVNETAKPKLASREKMPLPVGSVVVKAKFVPGSDMPKEVAAMIKREAGFDPGGGDWEYLFVDQKGKLDRGKLANCKDCHLGKASTDYLFVPYLTAKATQK